MIHHTAIISETAQIGKNVEIGPYSIVGDNVWLGDNVRLESHVVIHGPTRIGSGNRISHFCTLGTDPQDKKYNQEAESFLEIGEHNVIREYCSINRGTLRGDGVTRIGSWNWIMAYTHIAHDCTVGDHVVFANNATLAGHVVVEDYVTLGGFTGVHQFCRVGRYSFTAISSVVTRDIPPYIMVAGNTARPHGLNMEGLRRNAFDADVIASLKRAYRSLYREGHNYDKAVRVLELQAQSTPEVGILVDFLKNSTRGIVR